MEYNKRALSITDLLALLQQRGLIVANPEQAEHFLSNVSYFRFAAYLRVFENQEQGRLFRANTTFEQAVALYYFDAELRKLLFEAIQKIEISLRSRIIHQFSLAHGPFWFLDVSCAVDKHRFSENLSTLERELTRTKEDFIREHYDKYGKEGYPPAWKMLELTSFGCLTKLYRNFADTPTRKRIARSFGVSKPEALDSWMIAVNVLRNHCAHHARVWNRQFSMMPQLPSTLRNNWIDVNEVAPTSPYAIFSCIAYWLNAIDINNLFVANFKDLLKQYPSVSPAAMGFPDNWTEQPLWQ